MTLAVLWGLGHGLCAVQAQGPDGYDVYYVAPDGACGVGVTPCYGDLQSAVDAADTPEDVIKVAQGVYTAVRGREKPVGYPGPDVIWQMVYLTKTVTIRGGYGVGQWAQPDPDSHPTTLDAGNRGRGLFIMGDISPVIEGLYLTGGNATGLGGDQAGLPAGEVDVGGGVYISGAEVVVKDTHVVSNVAAYGGGLYILSATVTLEQDWISRNVAGSDGGGVYLNQSEARLRGTTLSFNSAGWNGGACYFNNGTAVLEGNSLTFNVAEHAGGAAYWVASDAQLQANRVAFNTAMAQGGGLMLRDCDASLVNTLLTDNWTAGRGSGMYVQASRPRFWHTTIARNGGGDGSGLYVSGQAVGTPSVITLTNTILVSQSVGITVTAGNTVSLEATLWGEGAWANEVDWAGAGTVLTGLYDYRGDPSFVCASRACALPYRIGPESAALDHGLDAGVTIDLDGETRPVGAGHDIGADECHLASSPPVIKQDRLFLAFYYPWYYANAWSHPRMLDRPLFPYRSDDELAIARHVSWARAAGLDGWVVSWWGSEQTWVDANWPELLQGMAGTDLRAALCFETLSPYLDTPHTVATQIEYALDNYGRHPNFLKRDGRPVIFLYAVYGIPREEGMTAYQAWQIVVDQLHADGYHPVLIGDTLDAQYLNLFDGLYPYLALQSVSFYQDISCQAHAADKLWVADVYPGYDDHLLDRPRHLYVSRDAGRFYAKSFSDALRSDPDWVVVTSFNEWWENTHIEPSAMYGYDYLLQTTDLAASFHRWHVLPQVYVHGAYTGPEDGSQARPFNTLGEALHAADEGATVYVAGGVYNGAITLTRSITLVGGYDPAGWKRDVTHRTTVLQGEGQGPVVRVAPGPCASAPDVVLEGVTIRGGDVTDAAVPGGGGVVVQGDSRVAIRASEILSNVARVGGGLFVGGQSRLELINVLVARNRASLLGGGLYAGPKAALWIVNSTLTDNRAQGSGPGVYVWSRAPQTVVMTNSIVWGNQGDGDRAEFECLGECRVAYSDIGGGWIGPGNLDVAPQFHDPLDADYHLDAGAPVVDMGDPAGVRPAGPAPVEDIDGDVRPWGGGVDLGVDEVGPLDDSTLVVDKAFALPGEVLQYTLTLTNGAQSESLDFWVTDTLSSLTDYVPDSLQVSTGDAVYTMSGGMSDTLMLPRILWQGTALPGKVVRLRLAVTVRPQSALDCATIRNNAVIRSAAASLQRDVSTRLGEGVSDYIVIQDATGPGHPVVTRTLRTGEALTVYAIGYHRCGDYVGPVTVNWRTTGSLGDQTALGTHFVFTPTVAGGVGRIHADDGQGHTDQTGQIAVVHTPPQLFFSPMALASQQLLGQRVTRPLTLSNPGGLTLTYEILPNAHMPLYSQAVEMVYEWDGGLVIDTNDMQGERVWDYFFTPEKIDPRLAGATFKVTEVEVQSRGIYLADWINWDLEVHLSDRNINLPEGQFWNSLTNPWSGYVRDAPVQFLLAVGEQQDARSYLYRAQHHFATGATTVAPFYGRVKGSLAEGLSPADGLHAQVFFWTGDPRVTVQFDEVRLVVRGTMTRTFPVADWLTMTSVSGTLIPVSGTLAPGESQVVSAIFDARGRAFGTHHTAVTIRSNDPDQPAAMLPVTLTVVAGTQLYLPLVMRNVDIR